MPTHETKAFRESASQLPFGPKTLLLGAGSLVLYGLSRRSKAGVALAAAGGILALKTANAQAESKPRVRATFLVNTSPERAYQLWRNLENLPRFMVHLASVRVVDATHSEWVARGPLDTEIRWNAEITQDTPNRRIAWRSLPGSGVETSGSVDFLPDPQQRGTYVKAEVRYGGAAADSVGRGFAALLGKHPQFMVREDVRRFKALLETGETPTIIGQTHGPRGLHGHAEETLFRENSNQPRPQAA